MKRNKKLEKYLRDKRRREGKGGRKRLKEVTVKPPFEEWKKESPPEVE